MLHALPISFFLDLISWIIFDKEYRLGSCALCMISGFCHEVDENYLLLGSYAASSGNSLPTIWYNLSFPSSRDSWPSKKRPIGCPKTLVRNYDYSLCNIPEECSFPLHCAVCSFSVLPHALRSSCFSQHPILEHPQHVFWSQCKRPSFTPI